MKRMTMIAVSFAVLAACGNTGRSDRSGNARDTVATAPSAAPTVKDTVAANRGQEGAADDGTIAQEQADKTVYSQKQLHELMDIIDRRMKTLDDKRLRLNIPMYGVGLRNIEVYMLMNTPEMRRAFREKVIDSPAIVFKGDETPRRDSQTGPQDTLGIVLRPEFTAYPTDAQTATFILANNGNCTLTCGASYRVTYDDGHGIWRRLPIRDNFNSLGYSVRPGRSRTITAQLLPDLHPNRAGRYRLFYEVERLAADGGKIMMMTEFRLTDDKTAAVGAEKTLIPIYTGNGEADGETVYEVVELMPQFPGGADSALVWLKERTHRPEGVPPEVKGRVVVSVVVMEDGSLEDVKVVKSADPLLDREAARIVRQMPKWIPGRQNGKAVKVKYLLPVNFQ